MKKLLSILLTVVMVSSLLTTNAFADGAEASAEPVTYNYSLKSCDNFNVSDSAGNIFGASSDKNVKYVEMAKTGQNGKRAKLDGDTSSKALSDGQMVKVSVTIASEDWNKNSKGYLLALGFDFSGSVRNEDNLMSSYVNVAKGNLGGVLDTFGKYTVDKTGANAKPVPNKSWVKLDYVLTVASSGEKCTASFYINGRPYVKDAAVTIDSTYGKSVTAVDAPSVCLRSKDVDEDASFYMSDLSMTIYPAHYTGVIVEANPFDAAADSAFTSNTDGSVNLVDITVDSAAIAGKAGDGWTYSYINSNGGEDIADEGYIIMTSESGTVYYEKLTVPKTTSLLSFTSDSTWIETASKFQNRKFNGNVYLNGTYRKENSSTPVDVTFPNDLQGKDNNKAVSLSFSSPNGNAINGFMASSVGAEKNTYTLMLETGKIAYEASVLIPSAGTRDFLFDVRYNSVMSSKNDSTEQESSWVPMRVAPSGKVTFAGDAEQGFEDFAINFGEWYRLTAVLNTNDDTGIFYINGRKAATYNFETLNTVSRYILGFTTQGMNDASQEAFSFAFDDLSIMRIRQDVPWTPAELELAASGENVKVDNVSGIIHASFESLDDFTDKIDIPAGATYSFYTDNTLATSVTDAVGNYLVVKNADQTIIREYVITSVDSFVVEGLDVSGLDTTGEQSLDVTVTNMTGAIKELTVILAAYNSDKELVALDTVTKDVCGKGATTYSPVIEIKDDVSVTSLKAFVWNVITPVCTAAHK